MGFYDNLFNSISSMESSNKLETVSNRNIAGGDNYNLCMVLGACDSLYHNLKLSAKPYKWYATEEEDPFEGLGDGLDDTGSATFGGSDDNNEDVNFDSFEDSSEDLFGDSSWGDDQGDEQDAQRAKALEVSRSDLLEESHNLGIYVRREVPKKIKNLIDILDNNISIITKHNLVADNKYTEDFKFLKESYQDIQNSVNDYLDIIDSKTFDEIFADYVTFLGLIDSVNEMYNKVVKSVNKSPK